MEGGKTMKTFNEPKMDVQKFEVMDILTTSVETEEDELERG